MITLSVVIPAFNCADSIEKSVNSVIASGITEYEIIIIDDGSSDGTAQICDILASGDDRIRCVHQMNAGVSAARNRGIREASGEYIWFVDADDSIREDSMSKLQKILKDSSPDMVVFGIEFVFYHNGRIFRTDELLPPVEGMMSSAACRDKLYDLFKTNSLSSLCNRIVKKSVMLRMDNLLCGEMILYEDLEFSLRVMKYCSSIFFYRESIYKYRQSEDEGNAGRRLKMIRHIPDLLSAVDPALDGEPDRLKILLSLYSTLAREKISVSSRDDITIICTDLKNWIDEHDLRATIVDNKYLMKLYRGQVSSLIVQRSYSEIRHRFANWLKQTVGDFRKW